MPTESRIEAPRDSDLTTSHVGPDRGERQWVAVFAVLVMLVSLLPYVMGYAMQGTNWRFTGFLIGVEDGNSYIAKMLSGSAGAWLFRTPYTAYPQHGVFTYLPYILLGKLAAPPGLHDQLVALYQLFRLVSGYLAIVATYDFIAYFIRKIALRRLGLVLAILGGGLGWLLILAGKVGWLGSLPLDFYSPESFSFLELFGLPHMALARALMLWGLIAYLRTAEMELDYRATTKRGLKIGLTWLITGLIQPLVGMILGVVVGIYFVGIVGWQICLNVTKHQPIQWDRLIKRLYLAVWAGIVVLPWVVYNFFSLNQDPFVKSWAAQNILPSPHPFHYLLAYGLLIPFAIWGAGYLIRRQPWNGWFPVAWFIALPLLAYAPTSIQRRLPEGVWVALVVLAMAGLEQIEWGRITRISSRWIKIPLFLAFPSTIILIYGSFMAVRAPGMPVFRPAAQVSVFDKLAEIATPNQVVLAAYLTGNALPAWAPVRVLIGQGPESVNLSGLEPRVAKFYQDDTPDSTRQDLLKEFQVRYVFWGPAERELGAWDPHLASYLAAEYQTDDYAIFSVR